LTVPSERSIAVESKIGGKKKIKTREVISWGIAFQMPYPQTCPEYLICVEKRAVSSGWPEREI
jgi:hypothetical protein